MTSSDSCVPNPSLISIRGIWPALDRVKGSKTFCIQYRLIAESVYSVLEQAKCHPGVEYVVQVLRCVAVGQMMRGKRDLPSADMHSIAVTKVRLTPAPL